MITFSKEAMAKFRKTIAHIEVDEAYVHCPDCNGSGQVYLYREFEDATSGGYFACPSCYGTKEQDLDDAIEFIREWERLQGIEAPI